MTNHHGYRHHRHHHPSGCANRANLGTVTTGNDNIKQINSLIGNKSRPLPRFNKGETNNKLGKAFSACPNHGNLAARQFPQSTFPKRAEIFERRLECRGIEIGKRMKTRATWTIERNRTTIHKKLKQEGSRRLLYG